jgi:hypothetical protein
MVGDLGHGDGRADRRAPPGNFNSVEPQPIGKNQPIDGGIAGIRLPDDEGPAPDEARAPIPMEDRGCIPHGIRADDLKHDVPPRRSCWRGAKLLAHAYLMIDYRLSGVNLSTSAFGLTR